MHLHKTDIRVHFDCTRPSTKKVTAYDAKTYRTQITWKSALPATRSNSTVNRSQVARLKNQ